MFYEIEVDESTELRVYMPIELYNHREFINKSFLIKAGFKKQFVEVLPSADLKKSILKISKDVLNYLSIPFDLKYQVIVKNHEIILGPVIGLLLTKFDWEFDEDKLKNFNEYAKLYSKHQGLLYIFAADSINNKDELIEGYYYKTGIKPVWKKGLFPLPNALYRKIPIYDYTRKYLKEKTNNNLFNSYYYNRLEFYDLISHDNLISKSIPDTCLLSSIEDVDIMLKKHDSIILKPITPSRENIIIIEKLDECYVFELNPFQRPVYIDNKEEALHFINTIKGNYKYIIQNYIDKIKYHNKPIDFRIIVQKSRNLKWQSPIILAYIGEQNSKFYGFKSLDKVFTIDQLNPAFININENNLLRKKYDMINLSRRICNILDNTNEHFVEFELHVIIDKNLNLWILDFERVKEILNPSTIKVKKIYDFIKLNPIQYALKLSGFKF